MAREIVLPSNVRFSNNETKVSPAVRWEDKAPSAQAVIAYIEMVDHIHNQNAIVTVTVEEDREPGVFTPQSTSVISGGDGIANPDTGVVRYGGTSAVRIVRRTEHVRIVAVAVGRPRIGVEWEFET